MQTYNTKTLFENSEPRLSEVDGNGTAEVASAVLNTLSEEDFNLGPLGIHVEVPSGVHVYPVGIGRHGKMLGDASHGFADLESPLLLMIERPEHPGMDSSFAPD